MRLKEDSSSWRGMGLKPKAKAIPEQPVLRGKKDTKRWCMGKPGREHDYVLSIPRNESHLISGWRKVPTCTRCGRQDDRHTLYRRKDGTYGERFEWGSDKA